MFSHSMNFFGVRQSSFLRSEMEAHQLLCLDEPWNIFFTVTQVHETGIPFSVFSPLNNFLDFSPFTGSQYNCIHSCDHLIAVAHAALTGMHPAAGLRLHGRPQATVAMQLERKQSDSRTLLHAASGPTIVHSMLQATIPDPFTRGHPSLLCMKILTAVYV